MTVRGELRKCIPGPVAHWGMPKWVTEVGRTYPWEPPCGPLGDGWMACDSKGGLEGTKPLDGGENCGGVEFAGAQWSVGGPCVGPIKLQTEVNDKTTYTTNGAYLPTTVGTSVLAMH